VGDEVLEELILKGYIEVSGIDSDTGQIFYAFTELAKKEMPGIEKHFEEEFHKNIMFFWENGFLDMNVFEENPIVRLNPKVFDHDALSQLTVEQAQSLRIIVDALRIR
jgi:hypothetical protein